MLVLTRKKKESIRVGDDIAITVLGIEGDQVKLGIDAPEHIDIHRQEVYVSIQQENRQSLAGDITLLQKLSENMKK
ncbi:carbon storage regulator [Marinococcus halophilus]|uniref:Translational regulator CsrA n=1 Tax=Marinococcus halophilus TaxID=1371 RepID=A0A510Y6V6_MARHA|nr:carbon storage regulator CsrA [Marinococcus halophilus]OZT79742.1 carbon storage regulator [Marinococcus halophilus]GEK59099.1 carbon storage regulator [Marinococcus halophilus]